MRNPMHEALARRKSKGMDLSSLTHPAGDAVDDAALDGFQSAKAEAHNDIAADSKEFGNKSEQQGDLAPEAKGKEVSQEKAIHAKAKGGPLLAGAISEHEAASPEHHPLMRGNGMDVMGHEMSGADPDVEAHLMGGHENDPVMKPRSLTERARAALQSKKTR